MHILSKYVPLNLKFVGGPHQLDYQTWVNSISSQILPASASLAPRSRGCFLAWKVCQHDMRYHVEKMLSLRTQNMNQTQTPCSKCWKLACLVCLLRVVTASTIKLHPNIPNFPIQTRPGVERNLIDNITSKSTWLCDATAATMMIFWTTSDWMRLWKKLSSGEGVLDHSKASSMVTTGGISRPNALKAM